MLGVPASSNHTSNGTVNYLANGTALVTKADGSTERLVQTQSFTESITQELRELNREAMKGLS